jgi:hypothetical protein
VSAAADCPKCGCDLLQRIAEALVPPPPPGTDRAFNADLADFDAEALRRERGRLLLHRLLVEKPSRWHKERLERLEALLARGGRK